jgi:hypothetical protein
MNSAVQRNHQSKIASGFFDHNVFSELEAQAYAFKATDYPGSATRQQAVSKIEGQRYL